jgi:predicted dehydrogenase
MSKLRLAIVGCGWVAGTQYETGYSHLPDLFDVAVCCDIVPEKADAFAKKYGIANVETDFEKLIARDDIDVVSICTPPMLHFAMVTKALAAGKNVICEKPLTSSLALADEIIAAEKRSRGRIMPVFQYRFGTGFLRARHLIRSGLLGKPYTASVETAWRRTPDYYKVPWRGKFATELGGVLLTQAIHIHDLFLDLAGPASAVAAFKATRVNAIEVEDCAVASLRLANGALASLTATLGSMRPTTRIRLCFERGTIERLACDQDAIYPAREPWEVYAPDEATKAGFVAKMNEVEPSEHSFFARQFELFHAALKSGGPFPVTLQDARSALELITALFQSAEEYEVVTLPIRPDHPRYKGWGPATS